MAESDAPVASFETALAELEQIVKQLESGELSLEKSLQLFENGVGLSDNCRKQLETAETRVELLVRKNGTVQPEPFCGEKS